MGSAPPLSLVGVITAADEAVRNRSLAAHCAAATTADLLRECEALDAFRRRPAGNLYERVRACFFLYAIHRFHLAGPDVPEGGAIPYRGYDCLRRRRFEEALEHFLRAHRDEEGGGGPSRATSSALAAAYQRLGLQLLAEQVRLAVRQHPGNAWMYQVREPRDQPRRLHPDLLAAGRGSKSNGNGDSGGTPRVLRERTPVRMDLSHCGWSDIFFLGMDYPEGARVLNASIDLAVRDTTATGDRKNGAAPAPEPPIDAFLRVLPGEPVLRLTSVDLGAEVTLTHVAEVFDFARDRLGLLRAGLVAAGVVPLGLEAAVPAEAPLADLLDRLVGPGTGLHLVTHVRGIPKGSRLAVSTSLLAAVIALCMRATGQTQGLTGPLTEEERRLVAARAILGEWLGGSGGGWQDSGGLWPGLKLIHGVRAEPKDPEHGTSRGRLLPVHRQLSDEEAPPDLLQALQEHLVLVHGGMSQNVGPVLEMVTEKYLLRESNEWRARQEALSILDDILDACRDNDIPRLAQLTTRNFFEPLQTIIPWASNLYTETIIERTREEFGDDFLGFWMLGGCSGGGMGFIFKSGAKQRALVDLHRIMLCTKRKMEDALPFAMDPCVYDFAINTKGTMAYWYDKEMPTAQKSDTDADEVAAETSDDALEDLLKKIGFDPVQQERVQDLYRRGKIGLCQNRLPMETEISDVSVDDVTLTDEDVSDEYTSRGLEEVRKGKVGVITLAAGVGSRWTQGAGCVKAIHPFCKLGGQYRTFLEIHLAKSRRISELAGMPIPHIVTTSFMTDSPIRTYLNHHSNHDYLGPVYLSRGTAVGVRLVPSLADLDFAHERAARLDEQAQKVRDSAHRATQGWAAAAGPGAPYRDDTAPAQCLHPVGHFWEVPNLLLNGTLRSVLADRPQLRYLLLHNVDTVGADVDPALLGRFAQSNTALAFEVVPRQIQDVGGGLAAVDGRVRLVEGLALPREEDEFRFSYYNTMTTWIDIDRLLELFGLTRDDLADADAVARGVRSVAARLPTYTTLKEVRRRWGNGQEDVLPTAQFEQLWSDVTALVGVACDFYVVPRTRGGQLKDVAQLDGWLRDGSAAHLEGLCAWPPPRPSA